MKLDRAPQARQTCGGQDGNRASLYDTCVVVRRPQRREGRPSGPSRGAWPWSPQPDPAPASHHAQFQPDRCDHRQRAGRAGRACGCPWRPLRRHPCPSPLARRGGECPECASRCSGVSCRSRRRSRLRSIPMRPQGSREAGWNPGRPELPGRQPLSGLWRRRLRCPPTTIRSAWEADRRVKLDKEGDIRVQVDAPSFQAGRQCGGGNLRAALQVRQLQRRRPQAPGVGEGRQRLKIRREAQQ